ncbi:hypothetical protein HDV03_004376 [Kappamyces sp. JEL0829]|nr:hypothetical protein HDV03_004376 [Kappamyces sp. JEL0829]
MTTARPLEEGPLRNGDGSRWKKRKGLVLLACEAVASFALTFSIWTCQSADQIERNLVYVEKIDSTGQGDGSLFRGLPTAVIRATIAFLAQELPNMSLYVYCATSTQYLFPDSSGSKAKRIRSDRNLIKWWLQCLHHRYSQDLSEPLSFHCYIPEESLFSAKSLFPAGSVSIGSQQPAGNSLPLWTWGLGVDAGSLAAAVLPAFPDDLATKAMSLSDPKATVEEVMEMMGVAEPGSRALVRIDFSQTKADKRLGDSGVSDDEFEKIMASLLSGTYSTLQSSKSSTQALISTLEALQCCGIEFSLSQHSESAESPVSSEAVSATNLQASSVKPAETAAPVSTLSAGLIKKKPLSTHQPCLPQPKPLSVQGLVKRKAVQQDASSSGSTGNAKRPHTQSDRA